jgi:hypothetical protein
VAFKPETGRPRAFAKTQRSLISQMYRPTKGRIKPPIVCKKQTPGTVDQIPEFPPEVCRSNVLAEEGVLTPEGTGWVIRIRLGFRVHSIHDI